MLKYSIMNVTKLEDKIAAASRCFHALNKMLRKTFAVVSLYPSAMARSAYTGDIILYICTFFVMYP
jgi:hypothetical protein